MVYNNNQFIISPAAAGLLFWGELMSAFHKTQRWKNKRKQILRRDKYLCRECRRFGKSTEATMVHHCNPIEERPDLALVNWNLISLCNYHHEQMENRLTGALTELGKYWRNKASPPLEG